MKRYRENIIHSRILKILFTSFSVFILLIGKLYWIQIKNHTPLKTQALKQHGKEIVLCPSRGVIYDRNLIPLTNRERIPTIFVYKDNVENNKELRKLIIENSKIDEKDLNYYIKNGEAIIGIPLKNNLKSLENNKDMYISDRTLRYSNDNTLSHVIGYTNKSENKGETGIEKVFDDILLNQRNESLYIDLDKRKNIILGGEHIVNRDVDPMEPNGVKLTIDYHIQRVLENILDEKSIKGSIIVSDVDTGDIVGMVSRPNFNQDDIDDYLDREDMALYNKAVQVAYPPGSLFKIVVLLTALEEDPSYINKVFYCKGYEQVNNTTIKCNNTNGHGYIDLEEAFSRSCNSAFIQLGQELGSNKIINMAIQLGFGEKINIGLLEEIEGYLPSGSELQGPAIGNISIGQGSIETTPIQINNMMMIIANNGLEKDMAIIDGITNKDGYTIKKFNRKNNRRVIDESNAKIAQNCLEKVVSSGTARSIDLMEAGNAGGKTGSAQAVLHGKETIHGWFSGYYPINDPRYVITVFIEENITGSQAAIPIFEKLVKEINLINR